MFPSSSLAPSSENGLWIMGFTSYGSTIMLGNDMKTFLCWGKGNQKSKSLDRYIARL